MVKLDAALLALMAGVVYALLASGERPELAQHPRLFLVLFVLATIARFLKIEVQLEVPVYGTAIVLLLAAVIMTPIDASLIAVWLIVAGEFYFPFANGMERLYQRKKRSRPEGARPTLSMWLIEPIAEINRASKSGERATNRPVWLSILNDGVSYIMTALLPGLFFHVTASALDLTYRSVPEFYMLFVAAFILLLALDFIFYEIIDTWIDDFSFGSGFKMMRFLLPVEGAIALLGAGTLYLYYIAAGSRTTALLMISGGLIIMLLIYWRAQYAAVTRKRIAYDDITNEVKSLARKHEATAVHSASVAYLMQELVHLFRKEHNLKFKHEVLGFKAGLVHDVGKIDWPIEMVDGTVEKFTEQHDSLKWVHARTGADRLDAIGEDKIAEIIRYHHLGHTHVAGLVHRYSYPEDLDSSDLPILSELMHLADSFDAMTARGWYGDPKKPDEAFEEMYLSTSRNPKAVTGEQYIELSDEERRGVRLIEYDLAMLEKFDREWHDSTTFQEYYEKRMNYDDAMAFYQEALDFYKSGLRRKRSFKVQAADTDASEGGSDGDVGELRQPRDGQKTRRGHGKLRKKAQKFLSLFISSNW